MLVVGSAQYSRVFLLGAHSPPVCPVRGFFGCWCASLKRRRCLAAAIAAPPRWPRTAGQGAGAQVFAGGVEEEPSPGAARLRSCRATSSAGALDATDGVTHPRRRRGSAPQVLSDPRFTPPADHRLERLETAADLAVCRVGAPLDQLFQRSNVVPLRPHDGKMTFCCLDVLLFQRLSVLMS